MATSKSPELWTGGALVYSGRRDPTWPVSQSVVSKLQKLWTGMPSQPAPGPSPPGLGYRGAFLRGPGNIEWTAVNGLVSFTAPAGVEIREDTSRKFERILLSSAPKGLLPAEVLSE
jgi:hypothetical protein